MRKKFWTEERIAQLRALAEAGVCDSELANHFGVTKGAIIWQAKYWKIRVEGRQRKLDENDEEIIRDMARRGCSVSEIARETKFHPVTIRKHAKRLGVTLESPTLTVKYDKKLRSMILSGKHTLSEIAAALDRTEVTILRYTHKHKISRFGIKRRKYVKPPKVKEVKPVQKYKRKTCLIGGEMFDARVDEGNRLLEYSCPECRARLEKWGPRAI